MDRKMDLTRIFREKSGFKAAANGIAFVLIAEPKEKRPREIIFRGGGDT